MDHSDPAKASFLVVVAVLLIAAPTAAQQATESPQDQPPAPTVDLSGVELASLDTSGVSAQVLGRPWYQNLRLSGFAAFWLARTGKNGTQPDAGFLVKEATLFVEAEAWEKVEVFCEVQIPPPLQDGSTPVRTGELYVHLRNLLGRWGEELVSLKVGRFDLPFGEEYLWQDAPDNPLVSNSAAYPWLWDEGIAAHGKLRGLAWVAAITDGTVRRSQESGPGKTLAARIGGRPWPRISLSASLMKSGQTSGGPLLLGGTPLKPVGSGGSSTGGISPSASVDGLYYELDAGLLPVRRLRLDLTFGQVWIDDAVARFDRRLTCFAVQPVYRPSPSFHLAVRYSEIGTYDAGEGYCIDGEFLAGGQEAFGYDARRLRRWAAGIGWSPNPRTRIKFEVGADRFWVIDGSPAASGADRGVVVGEVAVTF
ncbi:MAG: hypothetical protein WDA75_23860 [Candidatus Latescibacterota bacterium]|jgi:hypothetical protein